MPANPDPAPTDPVPVLPNQPRARPLDAESAARIEAIFARLRP